MSINVKPVQKYIASDGSEHADRKAAVEHEKYLQRQKNLAEIWPTLAGSDDNLSDPAIIKWFVAINGAALLKALTVVETRKKAVA